MELKTDSLLRIISLLSTRHKEACSEFLIYDRNGVL